MQTTTPRKQNRDRFRDELPACDEWIAEVGPGQWLMRPPSRGPMIITTKRKEAKVYAKFHLARGAITHWTKDKLMPEAKPVPLKPIH